MRLRPGDGLWRLGRWRLYRRRAIVDGWTSTIVIVPSLRHQYADDRHRRTLCRPHPSEVKRRPLYVVCRKLGFERETPPFRSISPRSTAGTNECVRMTELFDSYRQQLRALSNPRSISPACRTASSWRQGDPAPRSDRAHLDGEPFAMLDVGCGVGTFHPFCAECSAAMRIDVSSASLAQARRRQPRRRLPRLRWQVLPFDDADVRSGDRDLRDAPCCAGRMARFHDARCGAWCGPADSSASSSTTLSIR